MGTGERGGGRAVYSGQRCRRIDGELASFDAYDNEAVYGGSNLYLSARDLHRWVISWYSRPLLSDAALARGMEVPVFANAERSRFNRLAWYPLSDRRAYVFTGHWKGFHEEIYWDADRRVSVVWITNVLEAKPLPPLLTPAPIDIVEGKAPRLSWKRANTEGFTGFHFAALPPGNVSPRWTAG